MRDEGPKWIQSITMKLMIRSIKKVRIFVSVVPLDKNQRKVLPGVSIKGKTMWMVTVAARSPPFCLKKISVES